MRRDEPMERPEPFAMTLYDYRDQLNWVRQMGWTDDELREVIVHEQASSASDYLNLSNFGGTALGVSAESGGGTSANTTRGLHNLYVYEGEVPGHLYGRLRELLDKGGPSGYENGQFGEVGEADFPPH